ncbi:MAG: glycosyltransferase, partial [Chloroflexi bacterium]
GVPPSTGADADSAAIAALREAASADHLCFKIGRFDPDKRWLMAVTAMAYLKQSGSRVRLLIRGGREPHGVQVMLLARSHGLHVADVKAPDEAAGLARVLRSHPHADVINVTSYIKDDLLELVYVACDAVLANSGHEPFGLVGLEVMAAGGLAMVGSTGEDYADPFRNALVLETEDPVPSHRPQGFARRAALPSAEGLSDVISPCHGLWQLARGVTAEMNSADPATQGDG